MTLYDGATFEYRGHTFKVTFPNDENHGAPWVEHDGHGPVSNWTTRDKRPGERVLVSDRSRKRYYDVQAAMLLAKCDGWGTSDGRRAGESLNAYRARAVEADFEFLRGWCNDDWTYIGVVVTLADDDDDRDESESLWGIESNAGDYLNTVAHELADEILARIEVDEPDAQRSEN